MAKISTFGWIRIFLGGAVLAVAAWGVFSAFVLHTPSNVSSDLVAAGVGGALSAALAKGSFILHI